MIGTTYSATSGQTDFAIPFGYIQASDISVTVNNVSRGFTIPTPGTLRLASAASGGDNVTLQRVTDLSAPVVDFTDAGPLLGEDLNKAVEQARNAAEEARSIAGSLAIRPASIGADDYIAYPADLNQVLVSADDGLGGFLWTPIYITDLATMLGGGGGGGGGPSIPDPEAGPKFLVSNVSGTAYVLSSLADTKTALGVGAWQLPDPSTLASGILRSNSLGTGYEFISAASLKTAMGLGTAASLDVGVTPNKVVQLDATPGPGGTIGRMPAVHVGLMEGIPPVATVWAWERGAWSTLTNASSTTPISFAGSGAPSVSQSWASLVNTGGTQGIQVSAGVYLVEVLFRGNSTGGTTSLTAQVTGASATSPPAYVVGKMDGSGPIAPLFPLMVPVVVTATTTLQLSVSGGQVQPEWIRIVKLA